MQHNQSGWVAFAVIQGIILMGFLVGFHFSFIYLLLFLSVYPHSSGISS
jgi:hypothetical protein